MAGWLPAWLGLDKGREGGSGSLTPCDGWFVETDRRFDDVPRSLATRRRRTACCRCWAPALCSRPYRSCGRRPRRGCVRACLHRVLGTRPEIKQQIYPMRHNNHLQYNRRRAWAPPRLTTTPTSWPGRTSAGRWHGALAVACVVDRTGRACRCVLCCQREREGPSSVGGKKGGTREMPPSRPLVYMMERIRNLNP